MLMKKSAVAVALMAALGAQAQVNLYGTLDMNLSSAKPSVATTANASRTTSVSNGGLTASYIGVAGEEDLGGGLKASFQLETLLNADTGSTNPATFWSRNANVAVASDFGKLTVGRKQKIFYDSVAAFSPFGSASLGTSMTLLNDLVQLATSAQLAAEVVAQSGTSLTAPQVQAALDTALVSETRAWDNSLTYETPNIEGFSGAVQISLKEAANAGNNVAVSGQYVAGPFAVGLAYQKTELGLVAAVGEEDTRIVLGGSYDLGMAKVYGQLGKTTWKDAATGATDLKVDAFQLGATVPVTEEGTLMVSAGQAKEKDTTNPIKRTIFSLGYDQNLSKRTDVYGVVKTDKITGNTSGNAVAVGVRHRF